VKPVHSLWHEVLGFIFLAVAALGISYVVRKFATLGFGRLALIIPFIVVTAGYGISSFRKARRISRS
jgi:cytochrome c oxidase subunit IV